jgi:putative endonuclease
LSRAKGNLAEIKAVVYLKEKGYTIVEQNFYSRFGEIDIIAIKSDVLHFVEVKSGMDFEQAIRNITSKKLSRILKTVEVYRKKTSNSLAYEIDAIVVTPQNVEYIENITL